MPRPSKPLVSVFAAVAASSLPVPGQEPAAQPGQVRFVDAFPAQAVFDRPVYLAHDAQDPEWYWVVEQTGHVFRIPRDGSKADRELVLDWSEVCLHPSNGGHNEEGLLGFAFDPAWGEGSDDVYVYYSRKTGGEGRYTKRESVVSRFSTVREGAGPIRIDPGSELPLLRVEQPWGNHNGGTLEFGPDGMLYIAFGDGGAADDKGGNGQNLGTLLATVLRIDVRGASADAPYRIPDDNPFVDRDGARGEIWAYGLRNPWRITFDRATGELWCGDVGQNTWEEVDRIVKGGNHGWPILEGTHGFPAGATRSAEETAGMIPPIAEYGRSEGISVTGGYVYRGAAIPALQGRFVYCDWALRNMWAVREDRDGGKHDVMRLDRAPGNVMSFAEEPDGELLLLCMDGRIHRMLPAGE